ncbi:hypothetical protein NE237_005102 [Protea cynaroides]|uniref:Solute carrier family 35 member F1 n=1 Tax=Protea cynaroides TaxID=273540 RepID=A0A9Q0KJV1_9MAGN|nr:hypothetical protein NE237_005102 [Protea cynaroides]
MNNWWNSKEVLRLLFLLFLGQVVSFTLAVTAFCSSLLVDLGVDLPLTQSFFTYALLALVFGCILLFRRQKLAVPWYWYIPLGFVDVQGNYLVIKAFQYSSITSVTILDCWTIPWVMILTWIFLRTRYSLWQFLGAAVCVVGLCLVLLSDAGVAGGGGDKPLLGDLLVIIGTICYAMSNVGEEFCVKKKDLVEVVSMLGVFGLLVSICEISIFERKTLEEVKWTAEIISLFAGFALSTFMFYCLVPFVLKMSGATMFNLSILTSDMWAVVIRIFFYHQQVDWIYYLAFGVVAIGLILYSITEKDHVPTTTLADGSLNIQYEALSEENASSGNEVLVA